MIHGFYSYMGTSLIVSYQIGNETKKLIAPLFMLLLD